MSTEIELKEFKVKDLQPFSNRFKINFKVVNKSEEREITNRNDPSETHRISDITIADETGSIFLSAWDDDIEFLEEGGYFSLVNGYVNVYRDSMRLSRGKFGNFESIDDDFEPDTTSNRSDEVHERMQRRSYNNNRYNDNRRSYNSPRENRGLRF